MPKNPLGGTPWGPNRQYFLNKLAEISYRKRGCTHHPLKKLEICLTKMVYLRHLDICSDHQGSHHPDVSEGKCARDRQTDGPADDEGGGQ